MLRLIPATIETYPQIWKWAEDSRNAEFFRRTPPLMDWQNAAITETLMKNSYIIVNDNEYLGLVSLFNNDPFSKSMEFGMMMEPHTMNQSRDACLKVFDYVFNYLKYNRLSCKILSHREKLIQRMVDYGFTLEGKLKESCLYGGEFTDEYILGLTRSAYIKAQIKE